MKKNAALLFVLVVCTSAATVRPAAAADKQHLQMMAEIRLLQEQQQQLQQLMGSLQDTLKTLNTKLDDQASANRKAVADQTLAVNNIGDTVRTLKEKTDETNVRISSVSQEIDALRQAVASQTPAAPPQVINPQPSGAVPGGSGISQGAPIPAAPSGGGTLAPPPGVSAQRMYESSFDDYTAGRYDMAISGFQNFVATFGARAPQTPDAQYNIGQSYYQQSKYPEARDAYLKVVNEYAQVAQPSTMADAYYKLGMTYERLNQVDAAKQAYQTVVQKYASTSSATLANSALQRLNRR